MFNLKQDSLVIVQLFCVRQAQINGFYDPCIGEEKSLRVRYLFRDNLHEVTIDENEALAIPRQCKF